MNEIIEYYDKDYSEKDRFTRDNAHTIEYAATMHFLHKYLPEGATILDCCAGTGAYAFPLARMGYRVTAGDLMPGHVAIMREKNSNDALKEIYEGDALDMSRFEGAIFDTVLCFGALYHLFDPGQRRAVIVECLRVLKPDGILALAYINRNAVYINHLNRGEDFLSMELVLKTGKNGIFYGMDFGEIDSLTANLPLKRLTNIGVDGLMYPLVARINALSDDEFAAYMRYHLMTCEQPSIIGHSMHGLWIGRKV